MVTIQAFVQTLSTRKRSSGDKATIQKTLSEAREAGATHILMATEDWQSVNAKVISDLQADPAAVLAVETLAHQYIGPTRTRRMIQEVGVEKSNISFAYSDAKKRHIQMVLVQL